MQFDTNSELEHTADSANEQDILLFVPSGPARLKILVLDSETYWPRLRQMLPHAEIHAMTRHEDVVGLPIVQGLNFHITIGDYRRRAFPKNENYFDMVLAQTCLADIWESYDTLMHISRILKDTGSFCGEFLNIRYYRVLEELRQGFFPYREKRLYAKDEVVKMLNDALFKEIFFVPAGTSPTNEEKLAAGGWEKFGFANHKHELSTFRWLFCASRSTARVANLKEMYTLDVHKKISRLLHRLEYGIDTEESMAELKELCHCENIFAEYMADFIAEVVVHPDRLPKDLVYRTTIRL